MKVEMTAEAITNRMKALDQLWELAVALKSSKIQVEMKPYREERDKTDNANQVTENKKKKPSQGESRQ